MEKKITQMSGKINDPLTEKIIGACYEVHNELGPGFVEKIYHNALKIMLDEYGLKYESEKSFDVGFKCHKAGSFRLDLVVEDKVVVEIKALATKIPPVFSYQLLSYLKASGIEVGLLINFGTKSCGVKRYIVSKR